MMRFFWTILLPSSAMGASAVLLLYLTRPLLYRMGRTQWRVRSVMAALCLFVLPVFRVVPALSSMLRAAQSAPAPLAGPISLPLPADAAPLAFSVPMLEGATAAPRVESAFWRFLPALWLVGMVGLLGYNALFYLWYTRRLKRESRPVTDAAILAALRDARQKSGLSRVPGLRQAAFASPLAVGVLRPCVYLPAGASQDNALDYAIYHECVHLRRRHLLCKLAAQIVRAAHWFNPAAWILPELLNEACEFDCDRTVASGLNGTQKRGYCAALLDAADAGRVPAPVSAFARPARILRRRIEAVLAPDILLPRRVLSVALCAALVLGTVGLTACAAGQAADNVAAQLPRSDYADSAPDESEPPQNVPEPDNASAPSEEDGAPRPDAAGEAGAPGELTEWVCPVPSVQFITTRFSTNNHRGVDFVAPKGDEILAANGGVVLEAEFHWSWGNTVLIDHENGMTTRYAHCNELLVQAGDTVAAGQAIALVGSTGAVTGNICHVEMTRDDILIDPLSVLPLPANLAYPFQIAGTDLWDEDSKVRSLPDAMTALLGAAPSEQEREGFEQGAQFREVTMNKPVTVMNQPIGEAYLKLSLCEYNGKTVVCDVTGYGFFVSREWREHWNVFLYIDRFDDEGTPAEITIGVTLQKEGESDSTLITSTFVPEI